MKNIICKHIFLAIFSLFFVVSCCANSSGCAKSGCASKGCCKKEAKACATDCKKDCCKKEAKACAANCQKDCCKKKSE